MTQNHHVQDGDGSLRKLENSGRVEIGIGAICSHPDCAPKLLAYLAKADACRFLCCVSRCGSGISEVSFHDALLTYPWKTLHGETLVGQTLARSGSDKTYEGSDLNSGRDSSLWQKAFKRALAHDEKTLILDIGSHSIKCGFTCDPSPTIIRNPCENFQPPAAPSFGAFA